MSESLEKTYWKEVVSLRSDLAAAQARIKEIEEGRQYHMNAINLLAKQIGALGETSDSVVELAIRKIGGLKIYSKFATSECDQADTIIKTMEAKIQSLESKLALAKEVLETYGAHHTACPQPALYAG